MLTVRELVGGLYFGAKGVREDGTVFDTCEYHPRQVERIARRAFRLAESRRGLLTSVDKANVLETSRMWRRVVDEMAPEYPGVQVEHMLVDNAAMQLHSNPQQFDVIVTENMFGDILSDLAAAVTGGLGMAPSASLSDGGPGLFEPVHGSAPDIAGTGRCESDGDAPLDRLCCSSTASDASTRREALNRAIEAAIVSSPTSDLGGSATTAEFGAAVREQLAVDGARVVVVPWVVMVLAPEARFTSITAFKGFYAFAFTR